MTTNTAFAATRATWWKSQETSLAAFYEDLCLRVQVDPELVEQTRLALSEVRAIIAKNEREVTVPMAE
jgi:hypothetical protein